MVWERLEMGSRRGTYLPLRYSEIWVGDELVRQVEVWKKRGALWWATGLQALGGGTAMIFCRTIARLFPWMHNWVSVNEALMYCRTCLLVCHESGAGEVTCLR